MKHVNSNNGQRVRSMALIVGLLAILFGASALFTCNVESIRSELHTTESEPSPTSVPSIEVSTAPTLAPSASPSPSSTSSTEPGEVTPTPTPSVAPTEVSTATPKPIESTTAPSVSFAAAPTQLAIPAANINVTVNPLECRDHIDPPEYDAGYWCSNYGKAGKASVDTVYIVGHSREGGGWQFNRLSTETAIGQTVELQTESGTVSYVVDDVFTHPKPTLGGSDIWASRPGHLYIISSFEGDIWNQNIIVSATPVK